MPLTEKEIQQLVVKLRGKYQEYAKKHNPRWFDVAPFEERLRMAVNNKMNLEGFILAEISNFEKTRERFEKKKQEKENSFSKEVDRIIEEQNARIKKYSPVYFHPGAEFEIAHFYGAVSEFTLFFFPVLWIVISEPAIKNILIGIEESLNNLSLPRGKAPAKRIEDHALILSRPQTSDLDIERDKNNYLKETAFVLHKIVDLCDGLLERRDPEWELPLSLNRLYVEDSRKKKILSLFSGHSGYGAIMKVRDHCLQILDDFRLKAFRKKEDNEHI
ncbi:MAG TPA: hypothetical protein PK926_01155 [Spirochaetota bacterium]|nr:hypothetical protein [Spirochaetota bacterium]HPI88636.1 hypothetical protein [Spirochaetota bacterium]HPR49598.1 hypothetical protein [Spirochaetota bacterium]